MALVTPPDRLQRGELGTWRGALVLAGVVGVLLTLLAFWPSIHRGISDFDDADVLLADQGWRQPFPGNVLWAFSTFRVGHYQPLTYLSYALDDAIAGEDYRFAHGVNLGLHALNVMLVWRLGARLLKLGMPGQPERLCEWAAWGGALLWGIHPLRVESVAWLTERRDVLSVAFLLGAMLAYLNAAGAAEGRTPRRRWMAITTGLLLASLLSKAWGMTFFVAMLVVDWYPLRRLGSGPREWWARAGRGVFIEKLPLAMLGIGAAMIAAKAQASAGYTLKPLADWGVLARISQSCYGLVFYVTKTLAPLGLSPMYELPVTFEPWEVRWVGAGVLVLLACGLALGLRRQRPAVLAAFFAYAVLVGPTLGVLQSGPQLVADRYSYLSTIPLFWLGAAGVLSVVAGAAGRRKFAAASVALVLLVLGVLTARQAERWRHDLELWKHAIDSGHDGPVLRGLLGEQLGRQAAKDPAHATAWKQAAVEAYRQSVALNDRYVPSWYGMGTELRDLARRARQANLPGEAGRLYAEAERAIKMARDLVRDKRKARLALGLLYIADLDRPKEALPEFLEAIAELERAGNPERTGVPYLLLAGALDECGDAKGSVQALKKAAEFADSRAQAREHLAELGVLVPK